MDAKPADVDKDGDLDLIIAVEFGGNLLLLNDGTGKFSNGASGRLPQAVHDSEDIAIADFDGDDDLDVIFVSEDDRTNEFYLNDGSGRFTDATSRLGVSGTSNAVLTADLDDDGDFDLLIGNNGQNFLLLNDGAANFSNETAARLPSRRDTTQDLELGDVDGDGDLDLLVGNEDDNRLLVNTGGGFFADSTSDRLPLESGLEETREADFGDVDNDGDLDIFFANVMFIPGKNPQNRLLLNDGRGFFSDVTSTNLPISTFHTADGDFVDIDADGDLDLIAANAFGGDYDVFLNNGSGVFSRKTGDFLPTSATGSGIDIEAADFNGDGLLDLYFGNFQGADILLLSNGSQ